MSPEPPPIDDPVFGRLEWEDGEALLGRIEWDPGRPADVFIYADFETFATADVIENAQRSLETFRRDERRYRLMSAENLNETRWGDEVMADEDVANLLRVATLEFDSAGTLTLFWDDGDVLFGGHNVVTYVGPDGAFLGAEMH